MATTGITFSGFNNIDFNVVLNAIIAQESQPLTALQTRQSELQRIDGNYATLATKLAALRSASKDLSSPTTFVAYSAASSDTAALTASASSSAVAGRYEVVVNELARAQSTVSATGVADTDTTVVASGGSITIGGIVVTLAGGATLRELADTINDTDDVPATASIVETSPGAFRLVLAANDTGASHAFTIVNNLSSTLVEFTDTDNDNVSGDSAGDNVVQATDASVLINNIAVTSASNTLTAGIPGVTLALQQRDPAKTVVVTVARDDGDLASRVSGFVASYNDLAKFASDQATAAGKGASGTLGRDALLRSLRNELRTALSDAHGTGAFTRLAEVGVGFNRTGELVFDRDTFDDALAADASAVHDLFAHSSTGVFRSVTTLIESYTDAGGFVPDARTRLSDELSRLGRRVGDFQERLAVRRRTLQAQFIAADQAMTRLKSQQSSLASFASNINSPI